MKSILTTIFIGSFFMSCRCHDTCYTASGCGILTVKRQRDDSILLQQRLCSARLYGQPFEDSLLMIAQRYKTAGDLVVYEFRNDSTVTRESRNDLSCPDANALRRDGYTCQERK